MLKTLLKRARTEMTDEAWEAYEAYAKEDARVKHEVWVAREEVLRVAAEERVQAFRTANTQFNKHRQDKMDVVLGMKGTWRKVRGADDVLFVPFLVVEVTHEMSRDGIGFGMDMSATIKAANCPLRTVVWNADMRRPRSPEAGFLSRFFTPDDFAFGLEMPKMVFKNANTGFDR